MDIISKQNSKYIYLNPMEQILVLISSDETFLTGLRDEVIAGQFPNIAYDDYLKFKTKSSLVVSGTKERLEQLRCDINDKRFKDGIISQKYHRATEMKG